MSLIDRAIQRTLQNEYRRQTHKRASASGKRPARAGQATGASAVTIAGQVFPASGIDAPAGASVAVRNVGRPGNATYVPDRASSVAYSFTNIGGGGGSGGSVPSPHDLSGVHHAGLLDWADLSKISSDLADLATRDHDDLQNVGPDQHHAQVHDVIGADHTINGVAFQVVGATATDTIGLLTPSSDPGGNPAILRTNADGSLALGTTLFIADVNGNIVSIDGTLFTADAGNNTVNIDGALVAVDGSANLVTFDSGLVVIDADNDLVTFDTDLLYIDADNRRIGLNRSPGNAALDVIAYSNADHTQRLKQKSGQTGRLWRVEDTLGDELIVLDSQGNLQSGKPGFVSGLTGWQITPVGNVEFNNGWFRGELHATIFVKDEVHVSGGTLLVATGGRLYSDALIDSTGGDTEDLQFETELGTTTWEVETEAGTDALEIESVLNYIEVEDSPTGPGFYFSEGEIVRSKTEVPTGITDFWFEIVGKQQMDGFQRYTVIKRSGTDGLLPAGAGLVSYGFVGDGRILLTSDLNYAPYIDVFTIGPEVWTGNAGSVIPRVRMGRLDGVGVTGTSGIEQYGIIMGTDLSNANSPYIVASNLQLRLHKIDLTLNDGTNDTGELDASGNLTLGTNIGVTNGKSFQVISTGADAGDVIIGRIAGNFLKWDQSTAALSLNGSVQIGGVPAATTIDVSDALSDANSYTDARESVIRSDLGTDISNFYAAAQVYGDARRAVGVSGSWTATDHNTIAWSGASVRFANGGTKTITDNNTGNMSARTYLYVDVTAAAPLTLQSTQNLSSIGTNEALVAVCDPGTDKASVSLVAGSTYISGDNIMTGSIVAALIKAGAITADKIWVDNTAVLGVIGSIRGNNKAYGSATAGFFLGYDAGVYKFDIGDDTDHLRYDGAELTIAGGTGNLSIGGTLTVGTLGAIKSSGKDSYNDVTPGFFLGYDTDAYRFGLGDTNAFLRWDGSQLVLKINNALDIIVPANDNLLQYSDEATSGVIDYTGGVLISSSDWRFPEASADKFVVLDNTFRIAQSRTINNPTDDGIVGEICWNDFYLFVCTGTNEWRRIPMISLGTYWD